MLCALWEELQRLFFNAQTVRITPCRSCRDSALAVCKVIFFRAQAVRGFLPSLIPRRAETLLSDKAPKAQQDYVIMRLIRELHQHFKCSTLAVEHGERFTFLAKNLRQKTAKPSLCLLQVGC